MSTDPRWGEPEPVDPRLWNDIAGDYSIAGRLRALVDGQTIAIAAATPERLAEIRAKHAKELAECKGTVRFIGPGGLPWPPAR